MSNAPQKRQLAHGPSVDSLARLNYESLGAREARSMLSHGGEDTLARIREAVVMPILRLPSADDALAMAQVLIDVGITCLQIPLTVPGATEVMAELAGEHGDRVLIGAGTVLDPRAADACFANGARFIVSPAVDLAVISRCLEAGVPVLAGALTPTEILTAWRAGASMVRVFPCSAMGGAPYFRMLRAPLPEIPLVAAGEVTLQSASDFIAAGAAALEVGSDLVDLDAVRGGRIEDVHTNGRLYLDVIAEARALRSPPTV